MKGHPKFNVGDIVKFEFQGREIIGEVFIVDKFGTFDDPSDVSYDIMVESENMLYKHFTEKLVSAVEFQGNSIQIPPEVKSLLS